MTVEYEGKIDEAYWDFFNFCLRAFLLMRRLEIRLWKRGRMVGHLETRSFEDGQSLNAMATESDKEDPLFTAVVSRYPIEMIAQQAIKELQLDRSRVDIIRTINDRKAPIIRSLKPLKWFSVAIAAGTLIAQSVPKEVFEYLGLAQNAYGRYQLVVLVLTGTAFLILGSLAFLIWPLTHSAEGTLRLADGVLVYCSILLGTEERPPTATRVQIPTGQAHTPDSPAT